MADKKKSGGVDFATFGGLIVAFGAILGGLVRKSASAVSFRCLAMLIDGQRWYSSVPGVVFTGPYNGHFVQDIGAAFFAAGLGRAGNRELLVLGA